MPNKLYTLLDKIRLRQSAGDYLFARMGMVDENNNVIFQAAGYPSDWVWVRIVSGGEVTVKAAQNRGAPLKYDLPIRLQLDPVTRKYLIEGTDPTAVGVYNPSGQVPASVPYHGHQLGSGLEFFMDSRFVLDCLVYPGQGMVAVVSDGFYFYNNNFKYFPGASIDLTSYIPGSANTWAWVLVGIDPNTNSLTATAGTAYPTTTALTKSILATISFTAKIPLAGIQLTNGDTAITNELKFADTRAFISGIGGTTIGTDVDIFARKASLLGF